MADVTHKSKLRSSLVAVNPGNVENMKVLVNRCFPVTYKAEFYERVAHIYSDFTRFITVNDVIVGGVCARVEESEDGPESTLHLLILLVFEKYRRFGLASKMLEWLFNTARTHSNLRSVTLHVQKSNEAAVQFYYRHGFELVAEIPNYYTDIEYPDGLHLRLRLTPPK